MVQKLPPKNGYLLDICCIPCWLSPQTFRSLAGLEVKLGQTLSQHGPDMVPQSGHCIEMFSRPYLGSVEDVRALAGLELKLDQPWSKMVQNDLNMFPTWPQYGPYMIQVIQHYRALFCWSLRGFQSKFQTFQISRSKDTVEIAKTWPFYGPNKVPIWSNYLFLPEFWCICPGKLHDKFTQRAKAELKISQECL